MSIVSPLQNQDVSSLVSDADIAFYRDNGYWISPVLFDHETLATARTHHQAVIDGHYETGRPPLSRSQEPETPLDRIVKIDNAYWADGVLARLVLDETIGQIAARLSRADTIRLWHDQLLFKPPNTDGTSSVGWHQDHHYWQCAQPAELLTAWIALVDVDEKNGCMEVVPGSHKWGLLEGSDFFSQDMHGLQARLEAETQKSLQPVACPLKAGSVSFHHCRTVHGSRPNLSPNPRISMVVHMQPGSTTYKAGTVGDAHSSVRLLSGKDGEPFAGPYFPVLWSQKGTRNSWK